ncbi:MAG: hypothetical protein ACJ8H8_21655 [Geminicoccaceae bacterium]
MRRSLLLAALCLLAVPPSAPVRADPPGVKQLIGTFVGVAADDPEVGKKQEQRDIVMEIEPYQERGLRLRWNNVTLVDGRRDVPGVKFRRDEVLLAPAPDRSFFLAAVGYDPFAEKKQTDVVKGDPLRWGVVAGESLDVFTFSILEDGTYEIQASRRHPKPDGVGLEFERIVDGEVMRHMSGHAVRAE